MSSQTAVLQNVRRNAHCLLQSIGVRRIVVVDDEYAAENVSVDQLIGICEELPPDKAATIPSMDAVPFDAPPDVWSASLRDVWDKMDPAQQGKALRRARLLDDSGTTGEALLVGKENGSPDERNDDSIRDAAEAPSSDDGSEQAGANPIDSPDWDGVDPMQSDRRGDASAAVALQELLAGLSEFSFVTLSLAQWKSDGAQYLSDAETARETLFLFDMDFGRERASSNEGLRLVREVQKKGASICGLVTHTVMLGAEHDAWDRLSREHDLDRNRFLVIAKQRLAADAGIEHYSFLRMARLAALSSRFGEMKEAAWSVFESSVEAAKKAMESVSVLDFDQIVLASSRREGVWEPDTLFRVFSVFMRREARRRMHEDAGADIPAKVHAARQISVIPIDAEEAMGNEPPCQEAIRVHRFELFESPDFLNRHHLPIDLGDVFQDERGTQYILLSQPCDLMVRPNGRRAYDDKCTRQVTLAELVRNTEDKRPKDSWEKIDWYDETTGDPAFVDFARAHYVRLAVLDLCVLNEEGKATINVKGEPPGGLIDPWQKHCVKVREVFRTAASRYKDLGKKQVKADIKKLLLPAASLSARFDVIVKEDVVSYEIQRVGRLLQPRAGALLTRFAQYRSRAAFEHDLDHRKE